jgi:diguanylate cyclase (GGDEF)-like protein
MRLGSAQRSPSRVARRYKYAARWSLLAVALSVVGVGLANALVGWRGVTIDELIGGWGASFVYVAVAVAVVLRAVRVRDRRAAWIWMAVGLTLYGAGNLVWTFFYDGMAEPPIPSISDGLWLALYPASYIALVLLAREQDRSVAAGVWLDGIIAGLGFAALGAAVVFGAVLESATGSFGAVLTNFAYPIADLLLAALVLALLVLRGWQLDRCWALLGAGFMLLYVADTMYLLRVASGEEQTSLVPNVFYLSAVLLLAVAAWQPQRAGEPVRVDRWSVLLVPSAFVVTSIGLLAYDHFAPMHMAAVVLAVLTLLTAMARTALTFRDVRSLAQTRREATTDELTSLPNRRRLLRSVELEITTARAEDGSLGLLIIDLDQFKKLNDTLGHHAGDSLLRQIGPRLDAVLPEQAMLARLGGDEFGVLLRPPCAELSALNVADSIGEALHQPFEVEGLHLHVAASVGIALFPAHATDAQQLLRKADIAMYQAKAARSGRELYARDRDTTSRDSLALASELPFAIDEGEFEVHFQPKAESMSGRVVGMEALVRWRHPQRGLIAPSEFVPLIEQAGLMRALTRTVISDALAACRQWRHAGHDLHVAVNVSFTDLMDADFPVEVATALTQRAVDPGMLILEITESSIMSDAERVGDVLARLSEFGVRISLDDFGTGYSSLTHLGTLPVDEVKIDRSFVARMRTDPTADAIVRAIIGLAHNLGMRVAAEGVEDPATWEALARLDCALIQGFHLGRPMPLGEVEAFLAAHATATRPAARAPV